MFHNFIAKKYMYTLLNNLQCIICMYMLQLLEWTYTPYLGERAWMSEFYYLETHAASWGAVHLWSVECHHFVHVVCDGWQIGHVQRAAPGRRSAVVSALVRIERRCKRHMFVLSSSEYIFQIRSLQINSGYKLYRFSKHKQLLSYVRQHKYMYIL